ncbi:MAG: biphenyl 2,3-dioxygenase [Alphaproteobacteria bacterium]|nr:biphenyl 2,3-dioxygenase [Alphaproteobacteria bacterium]
MRPLALGYIAVSTKSLADWQHYAASQIGLQRIDRTAKTAAFRMDDRKQRLVVHEDGGSTISAYGWEFENAAALDAFAAQVEQAGVKVQRGSRALADERHVSEIVIFHDPAGNRLEAFHSPQVADEPFKPGRNIAGFRTGALGLGHAVLNAKDPDPLIAFCRDVMQFGVSDYYDKPFKACFFHVNPRHHSFAVIQHTADQVHHLMMEYFAYDDMGHGWDIAQANERVAVTLGRHAGDDVTSFYTWTPSGFMIESGWGGKSIDPAKWEPGERLIGPSIWGHERLWMPPEQRKLAREMTLKAADMGYRRKVQVIDGNYNLMPGTCPWWDAYIRDKAE